MPEIVPSDMHAAVLAQIRAQFPDLATVADYRELGEDQEKLPLPAVLVEMTDMDWSGPEANDGTDRVPVDTVWDITIVMGFRTPEVGRALRDFAAALAVFVHGNRWGLREVEPAVFTAAGVHDFSPVLTNYQAWRVEFRQTVYLGVNVWENAGTVPEAFFSWSPEIGVPHEADYRPLEE